MRIEWLAALVDDLARSHEHGADVLVVSSGAIALGRRVLELARRRAEAGGKPGGGRRRPDRAGQAWAEALGEHDIVAGQILLTLGDTEERRRYLNARATIGKLLELRAVPVINENDTVATSEIRYGDNDRLAARVADDDGRRSARAAVRHRRALHRAAALDPDAQLIPVVRAITPEIEAMAGGAGSELARGGMRTKIEAGEDRDGRRLRDGDRDRASVSIPLAAVGGGRACTWFLTPLQPRHVAQDTGSPARSSRRARCISMPARCGRCARARACCRPA